MTEATTPAVPEWAIELAASAWDAAETKDTPQDDVLCAVFAIILAKLDANHQAEMIKQLRFRVTLGDAVTTQVIAMQAAVIAHELEGPAAGIRWIKGTLFGPGFLPDIDAAKALGGAQAWFDAKMAEHEAFLAANPIPTPGAAR